MPIFEWTSSQFSVVNAEIGLVPTPVLLTYNAREDAERCLSSLLRFTPTHIPIVIVDDCSTDANLIASLKTVADPAAHNVHIVVQEKNLGFVGNANYALSAVAPNDVILVNSDVMVGAEWFERICAAAQSTERVATVSVFSNHGTILSIPNRNQPGSELYGGLNTADIAKKIAAASQQLRPRLPTAVGHFLYVTRQSLNEVGYFDPLFGPGYGEEVDFSLRARAKGFENICADDVFVFHRGNASFGARAEEHVKSVYEVLKSRYDWYDDWVYSEHYVNRSPLASAILIAKTALTGINVGVDASMLDDCSPATQQLITETLFSLANHSSIATVSAFVPSAQVEKCRQQWSLPNLRFADIAKTQGEVVDVMIRPCLFESRERFEWAHGAGARLVVLVPDFDRYDNPFAFEQIEEFFAYNDAVEYSLSLADGVGFLSESLQGAASSYGLCESSAVKVVVGGDMRAQVANLVEQSVQRCSVLSARIVDRRLIINHRQPGIFFPIPDQPVVENHNLGYHLARQPIVFKLFPVGSLRRTIPAKASHALSKAIRKIVHRRK